MNKRSLPPYGREVAAILRQPAELMKFSGCTRQRATIWLSTGFQAWEWRNERPQHLTVVLPPGADPAAYDWRFMRGHEPILLIGADAENVARRRDIGEALLKDGVSSVLAGKVLMETKRHHEARSAAA